MLNQKEKESQDFVNKFIRSLIELEKDFDKLSENDKARALSQILVYVKVHTELKAFYSIMNHR